MEYGSCRGIKLLEHLMKVVEMIFEQRIQQQIDIESMQFGFMKGIGTTDTILIIRQVQEKFTAITAKGKKLHLSLWIWKSFR